MLSRLLASDPGLNRLRLAVQVVVTIGAAMAAEWAFVQLTHAMQIADGPVAVVAAQHHGITVVSVMVGAVVGMIAAFTSGMFPTKRALVQGYALMPPLMIAGLALGLALGHHRTISLTLLVLILAVGAYCRRWGPLGFVGGQMVFMGNFFGFFLDGAVQLHDLGWLAAEVCLAAAVALLAQFTLFYPGRRAALVRLQRSYAARRRDLVAYAVRMIDEPEQAARMVPRLERRLVLLNEAALMTDAHLNHPGAIPSGWSAESLHQILFDVELSVGNMGRFAGVIAVSDQISGESRALVRDALVAVGDDDVPAAELAADRLLRRVATADGDDRLRIVLHRFALSVLGHCGAQRRLREARRLAAEGSRPGEAEAGLGSPIVLMAGWLPGSALVSAEASANTDNTDIGGSRLRRLLVGHVPLAPNLRVAIQMAVAVAAAIVLGEVLSERRFYWAVIAAFVTFMGANSATEQVRKGILRIVGTAVGAVVGALLAHLVGGHGQIAVAVILAAIFLGIYFMRISYAFMVIGITVMVSQLYVQLDEFSDRFLLLRLEETALGAAIAAITVVCVLPLRTGRVARLGGRNFLTSVDDVAREAVALLGGGGSEIELRAAVRRMDDAYQTLLVVAGVLRVPLFDRDGGERDRFHTAASAARNYARNLLVDAPAVGAVGPASYEQLLAAREHFSESLSVLIRWLDTGAHDAPYVRSASLFDPTAADADFGEPLQLTVRDLELLDGALATMAGVVGLRVEALDTRP